MDLITIRATVAAVGDIRDADGKVVSFQPDHTMPHPWAPTSGPALAFAVNVLADVAAELDPGQRVTITVSAG